MKHHFKQISNKVTLVLTFTLGLYLCKVYTDIHGLDYTVNMGEETGGGGTGKDLPLRTPLIPFPGWDPGGTQYITQWALFTSLGLFFSNCNSCIGGLGPFETLGDPFP